jgi:glycolate oxidase iron-sulfur subunit
MQTELVASLRDTPDGIAAEAIVRSCVHCGFCNATCPTYQLLGDELDGPRGRIYLIKQVLEGTVPTRATQVHLDRCLTCRHCETTCPSGVRYGELVEIGRRIVDRRVDRPMGEELTRWLLKEVLPAPLFDPLARLGRRVARLLPPTLREKLVQAHAPRAEQWPNRAHQRKVLLLMGCVQPTLMPNVNSATARVLDAAGIQTLVADDAGCCGAIRAHLGDADGAREEMRNNIDAWWPLVDGLTDRGSVEAIVVNASGCALAVKEYGAALADDPAYADKARRISSLARDVCELLPELVPVLAPQLQSIPEGRWAFHPPCTLTHGQRLPGIVETQLRALGLDVQTAAVESHLCCGSAGTYSVLQPVLAQQLRERKLVRLQALEPVGILSANIGCIQHLQAGTQLPVRHWIEVVDEAL